MHTVISDYTVHTVKKRPTQTTGITVAKLHRAPHLGPMYTTSTEVRVGAFTRPPEEDNGLHHVRQHR